MDLSISFPRSLPFTLTILKLYRRWSFARLGALGRHDIKLVGPSSYLQPFGRLLAFARWLWLKLAQAVQV